MKNALSLQREPKSHVKSLVPILLAALTLRPSIIDTVFLKNELWYIRNAHFGCKEHHVCVQIVGPESRPGSAGIL